MAVMAALVTVLLVAAVVVQQGVVATDSLAGPGLLVVLVALAAKAVLVSTIFREVLVVVAVLHLMVMV